MTRPLVVGALILAVLAGLAWFGQRRLVYLPDRSPPAPPHGALPGAEPVTLRTSDGLDLGALFVPASGSRTAPPGRDGARAGVAVLVCNGNAGNRGDRLPLAAALSRRGLSVLLFDYRGYGGNPGSPSEAGLARDVRAAHAELASRPGVDPDRLLYYGESLGAAVALDLAVERPPAGLVLRSPFASLADAARVHYPFVPAWLLRDRFDSVGRVRSLSAPLLVVVGENDDIVPAQTSRRLYALAAEPKRLVVVPGANHNDRALLDGDELITAVVAFTRDVAGR